MKSKKVKLLIKVLIPLIIIGTCFGVEKIISIHAEKSFNKPIIVEADNSSRNYDNDLLEVVSNEKIGYIKGLTENYGFIDDNKILLGIGMEREEFYKKYPEGFEKGRDEALVKQMDNEYYGKVCELNLIDSTQNTLNINVTDVCSDLLSGGDKLNYADNNELYTFDLNNELKTKYGDMMDSPEDNQPHYKIGPEYIGNWSKDGKCFIYYENGNLKIYNIKANTSKSFKVDNDDVTVNSMPSYYSDDGENVYFIGVKYKKSVRSQGIFKLNCSSGEVEETLLLPPVDYTFYNYSKVSEIVNNDYCVLEGGKRIIFNGAIEGIDGTYIYDVENNKYYNVIPHNVKSEEGAYCSRIWVSPDKSKIAYITLAEEDGEKHWNLYAAKVNGNSLTNRICIYKDIFWSDDNVAWSSDSKKILFFTCDDEGEVKNNIRIQDKNDINIVTFR